MQLTYLASKKPVKKFVLRGKDNAELKSSCIKIKFITPEYGKVMFDKNLSETSHLFIILFDDFLMKMAWVEKMSDSTTEDVVEIKIITLTRTSDEDDLNKKSDTLKKILPSYNGYFLDEDVSENEIFLTAFFTNLEEMDRFTREQNIK